MSFQFSDQHIADFHTHGFTVFRGIVPAALLSDLRRETDRARAIARQKKGPQAQRLQPIEDYDIDQRPFQNYKELPNLIDALARVLSSRHKLGKAGDPLGGLGVLLEPADLPWCTPWHRDWRDHMDRVLAPHWERHLLDFNMFNQSNCALYNDDSTWVVPGSHLRADVPGEKAAFPEQPPAAPQLEGLNYEQRELAGLEYCRKMPGAVRLCLDPGDFALYRNTLWHLGNYVPYKKRATLHDSPRTPEYNAWMEEIQRMKRELSLQKQAVPVQA